MQKKLSVVIPAYNYSSLLPRAVESVASQLNALTELIVVNDGSTDDTAEVLNSLKAKLADKLTIFSKQNGGLASTRNFGIAHAKGEFIVFLDADDEMHPEAISNICNFLNNNSSIQFLIGGHYSITSNGKKKLHSPNALANSAYDNVKGYLIDKSLSISNGACVMHRDIFKQYQYPERFRNSEDISMFAYSLANFNCATMDVALANIYKHDDSLRHNANYAESVGLQLVDEVFDTSRIAESIQSLKKPFLVQRLLSLSRVCHENNRHAQCITFFKQALKLDWRVIFKWSYSKKCMRSLIKTATA